MPDPAVPTTPAGADAQLHLAVLAVCLAAAHFVYARRRVTLGTADAWSTLVVGLSCGGLCAALSPGVFAVVLAASSGG